MKLDTVWMLVNTKQDPPGVAYAPPATNPQDVWTWVLRHELFGTAVTRRDLLARGWCACKVEIHIPKDGAVYE